VTPNQEPLYVLLRNNLRVERDKLEAEGSRFGVQFCD
jgi:hypothetical protein